MTEHLHQIFPTLLCMYHSVAAVDSCNRERIYLFEILNRFKFPTYRFYTIKLTWCTLEVDVPNRLLYCFSAVEAFFGFPFMQSS